MSLQYIFDLSSQIWNELGQPTSISTGYITGKILSSGFLGKLGTMLDNSWYIDAVSGIVPDLLDSEQAIVIQLVEMDYYVNAYQNALGVGSSAVLYVSLAEGDSRLTRTNQVDIAKFYKDLQKDTWERIRLLVNDYKLNKSTVQSVDWPTIGNYPNWGAGNFGRGGNIGF
jgi:hypothetical protein